ncbi:MAG TPA: acylphosphatase [Gemmatimonadaceae bacterium]|nr:acylphosphatase [Gemmatimonadaceae bacterium]
MAGVSDRAVRGVVNGRVQGVGYRWFLCERARSLGVAGWVRNLRDGAVEFVARGDTAAVDRLIAAAREGPARSSVTSVDTSDPDPVAEFPSPFAILH